MKVKSKSEILKDIGAEGWSEKDIAADIARQRVKDLGWSEDAPGYGACVESAANEVREVLDAFFKRIKF